MNDNGATQNEFISPPPTNLEYNKLTQFNHLTVLKDKPGSQGALEENSVCEPHHLYFRLQESSTPDVQKW